MKALAVVAAIGVLLLSIFGLSYWGTYNNLIGLREEAVSSATAVQIACQRQADLVPNLVKAVKSYAAHEASVLTAVTQARARVSDAFAKTKEEMATDPNVQKEMVAAQQALRAAMVNVVAVAEKYPDLKASSLYQDFMSQLEGSQNRISHERGIQNKKVTSYNTARKGLFTSMFLGGQFQELPYYEAPGGDKSSVEVDL